MSSEALEFDDTDATGGMVEAAGKRKQAEQPPEPAEERPKRKKAAHEADHKSAIPGARRANMFMVPIERLTLVTDPKHHLYRPDVRAPLDDRFVQRLAANLKTAQFPCVVCKDGERILIVDGRTRYRAIVERINPQRIKEGLEPIAELACVLQKGNEQLQVETSVDAHLRKTDDPFTSAIVCGHYLQQLGEAEDRLERAAERFGVSVSCVKVWERVFGLSRKLQQAIEKGAITITEAAKHHEKSKAEQDEVAQAALDKQARGEPKRRAAKRPGKALVASVTEAVKSGKARVALLWAQGKCKKADLLAEFPELEGIV